MPAFTPLTTAPSGSPQHSASFSVLRDLFKEHGLAATEFPIIQGLRAVAALLVCLHHLGSDRNVFPSIHFWIRNGGQIGVEVFFVISGFIVPYSMFRAKYRLGNFPRFLLKRIVRIDPPYLTVIALTLALNFASSLSPLFTGPRPTVDPQQLLLHLGYLVAFTSESWLSPVFWTLAIEFQFYLLIGVVFSALFSGKFVVRCAALLLMVAAAAYSSNGAFVGVHLPLFLAGIFLCQIKANRLIRHERMLYPILIVLPLLLKIGWPATLAALFTFLLIAFVRTCPAILCRLGDFSYSLYLIHWPIGTRWMNLGARFAQGELQLDLLILSGLAISLASAWLLYRSVEVPSKNLARLIKYRMPHLARTQGLRSRS